MDNFSYFLNQLWLSHKEAGLGPFVVIQFWITIGLLAVCITQRIHHLRAGKPRPTIRDALQSARPAPPHMPPTPHPEYHT